MSEVALTAVAMADDRLGQLRRLAVVPAYNEERCIGAVVREIRAVNRRGIALFAADYPHDYPEVEAIVLLVKHRFRFAEVPVAMRPRAAGRSSITAARSVYYMVKVLLAVFVGLFRKYAVPAEAA